MPNELTEEQKKEQLELKNFLGKVYEHSQTLADDFRMIKENLENNPYQEPTWEELYNQKTLHTIQYETGMVLDDIDTISTKLNYLRAEYKRSKVDYGDVLFDNRGRFELLIDRQMELLKDYERGLKSIQAIWDRRYRRICGVGYMQSQENRHRALT